MLLAVGLVLLGLYCLCVIYPYHLGGYGDLSKGGEGLQLSTPSFGVTRPQPLGITRLLPVAIFSYLFSYKIFGLLVLTISIVCIYIGTLKKTKPIHYGFTALAILITIFASINMDSYEIINFVLE